MSLYVVTSSQPRLDYLILTHCSLLRLLLHRIKLLRGLHTCGCLDTRQRADTEEHYWDQDAECDEERGDQCRREELIPLQDSTGGECAIWSDKGGGRDDWEVFEVFEARGFSLPAS